MHLNKKDKVSYKQNSTCCSRHLETKVMLNVQLESDQLKVM